MIWRLLCAFFAPVDVSPAWANVLVALMWGIYLPWTLARNQYVFLAFGCVAIWANCYYLVIKMRSQRLRRGDR